MITTVRAVSEAEYRELTRPSPPRWACNRFPTGEMVFRSLQCHACHSVDGSRGTGPTLRGLYGRVETMGDGARVTVDDAYLRRSILEPNAEVVAGYGAIMPTCRDAIQGWQMDRVVAYLRSLAAPPAAEATASGPRPPRP